MNKGILIYIVFMSALSLVGFGLMALEGRPKKDFKSQRMKQTKNIFGDNAIVRNIDDFVKEKVKISKRQEVESFCIQAGVNLSATEFYIISATSSIVTSLIFGTFFKNTILGIILIFIGFILPRQILAMVRNKRLKMLDEQVGTFIEIISKRYAVLPTFKEALEKTAEELKDYPPIGAEIQKTLTEVETGTDIAKALDNLAERTNNPYLLSFATDYRVGAEGGGTKESRIELLEAIYEEYKEEEKIINELEVIMSSQTNTLYMMTAAVPLLVTYQIVTTKGTKNSYLRFMTTDIIGKISTIFIFLAVIFTLWLINSKLSAPLRDDE